MMLPLLCALAATVQGPQTTTRHDSQPTHTPLAVVTRASQPPVIDGRDDDPVWREAPAITDFKEWRPTEGAAAKLPTVAKIAYDAANLYVLVHCVDAHPDSIITQLARRDNFTPTDMVWLFIDSYHDRRTGYEFGVNPSGVKLDAQIFNDGNEDFAWDAVWDVATRVDSTGWTAEFRIPLSQMRYGSERAHTFGITLDRDIYRYNQRLSWPLFRQSQTGFVSQFGEIAGFDDLEAPRRLEAAPYVVTKNVTSTTATGFGREQDVTVGGDLKYRIASNLTLDATLNPDFGQVEADPAAFNLSAYEIPFGERRPFFVAGRGVFQFSVNCNPVNCGNEGLFYSRRIGRSPELTGYYGGLNPPAFTNIIGAGKLTGRFGSGLRLGVLEAVTGRASGVGDTTLEPATNYSIVRLQQDYRRGEGTVGAIVTAVNRDLDPFSGQYLRRNAYVGAVDFRQRFLNRAYEFSGSLDYSRVTGSPAAILATQTNSTHYYQRPDAGLPLDSNATALSGDAEEVQLQKIAGEHLLWASAYQRRSPGFEINDLGFLRRSDYQTWATWVGFFDRHVRSVYQRLQFNNNFWMQWTASGLVTERAFNDNTHINFKNNTGLHFGGTVGQLGETYCDRCARGGPAVRQDPYFSPWLFLQGDDRHAIVPYLSFNWWRGDQGRSHTFDFGPELDLKLSTASMLILSPEWNTATNDVQPLGPHTDAAGTTHYAFGHLDQRTFQMTFRFNYTFSPNASLQVYAQPFITKGTYSNIRQLSATPRAADYDSRYQAYTDTAVTNNNTGFDYKQWRSNVVFRWEYRPGSTLFVVWSQGRQGSVNPTDTHIGRQDFNDLFGLRPDNAFLVKVSYWLNR